MRLISVLLVTALTLTGCDLIDNSKTAQVDPNNLAPLSSREQSLMFAADGAMQQGNYAEAERDYMGAVAESKGKIDAHLALANLYEKQNQPTKEKTILERALTLQPNHPLANYKLGKLYLEQDDYAAALAAFQRGRVNRPDDVDLTIGEAVSHDMLGNHAAAQPLYASALRTNIQASSGVARTDLAMSYILSNEPQKAIDLLREAAAKPEASPVTRHNLALAYGLVGRHGDAKLILKGDIDEATRNLAIARMKEYYAQRSTHSVAPPITPTITQLEAPKEIITAKPAPVIVHSPEVKKVAKTKPPEAKKPVVDAKAAVPAKPVAAAPAKVAPAAGKAETLRPEDDPNYMPGLEDTDDSDAAN